MNPIPVRLTVPLGGRGAGETVYVTGDGIDTTVEAGWITLNLN